jgi:hypothetical protein
VPLKRFGSRYLPHGRPKDTFLLQLQHQDIKRALRSTKNNLPTSYQRRQINQSNKRSNGTKRHVRSTTGSQAPAAWRQGKPFQVDTRSSPFSIFASESSTYT